MTAIKLYLDTRRMRQDGKYPLKISVKHRSNFFLHLKVYTLPEHFINDEVLIPGDPKRQEMINDYISGRLRNVESIIYKHRILGTLKNLSDADLKKILDTERDYDVAKPPPFFIKHFDKFIEDKKNGVKKIYHNTRVKLAAYCNIETLLFDDITTSWLKNFDKWMSKSCATNTRAIHMRNIRAVFNDAIDDDIIDQGVYPFRKFKIKHERTRKRALTLEDIRKIRDYDCEEHQVKYRDMFMLIFYLIGINIGDLANLKEVINGRIEYRRAKTGRLYSIKVEPEAQEIIDKYRGDKYLLNILDNYVNYKDYLHRLNNNLKEIGTYEIVARSNGRPGKKEYAGLFHEITTYWARHTWATIAASIDIPKETIAAALGHGGNSITDIYIDFDQKKVDEANRKVIDWIKSN